METLLVVASAVMFALAGVKGLAFIVLLLLSPFVLVYTIGYTYLVLSKIYYALCVVIGSIVEGYEKLLKILRPGA